MRNESCGACRFFEEEQLVNREDNGLDPEGVCRRFPPVLALPEWEAVEWEEHRQEEMKGEGGWIPRATHSFVYWTQPHTYASQWCGEYQERKEDQDNG